MEAEVLCGSTCHALVFMFLSSQVHLSLECWNGVALHLLGNMIVIFATPKYDKLWILTQMVGLTVIALVQFCS
jgi:hypothetical protein